MGGWGGVGEPAMTADETRTKQRNAGGKSTQQRSARRFRRGGTTQTAPRKKARHVRNLPCLFYAPGAKYICKYIYVFFFFFHLLRLSIGRGSENPEEFALFCFLFIFGRGGGCVGKAEADGDLHLGMMMEGKGKECK